MAEGYCPLVPDVLQDGLALVFCGTAPSRESFRQKAYYAHPGNLFWRTLHATGLIPQAMKPQEYSALPEYGIGLTDVCKTAFGNDDDLGAGDFDGAGARERVRAHAPRMVAFTSKKAASVFMGRPLSDIAYGLQAEALGRTRLFVLPSPSGHARRYWREDIWHELATLVRGNEKREDAA